MNCLTRLCQAAISLLVVLVFVDGGPAPLNAQHGRPLGTLREQAAIQQDWLELRLTRVLPRLMREHDVDMWIIPMREYNEDPVFGGLVSPTTFAARRRTIYAFCDRGPEEGVDRIAIGGSSQGGLYRVVRDPNAATGAAAGQERQAEPWGPDQWQLLPPIVEACDPETIAVNISYDFNFSDGLSAGEWEQMSAALPEMYRSRIVRRDRLALDYIAERLPEMLPVYIQMQKVAHQVIATAFSNEVITPGVTRTQDVVWWMRQRLNDLGLDTWFQPSVEVQRRGVQMGDSANPVIVHGDLLHCDFGVTALGLNTDTQHMGYVLRPGETDAPAGLYAALTDSNKLQDIVVDELQPGRTGDDVLHRSLARMREAGIDGTVYSHPIGDHGHGAGPLVGLWDRQEGVPGRGDVPVRTNTWWSIELQSGKTVPEWNGQLVRMALEEDVYIGGDGKRAWVLGRQEKFHLVR
ncbi:MAG TPA: M24 family metallopeptidase [Gemmatimonadota bacterium]|nr:M24 family metallopeptidase [Gemmatimonadota bacterium]